MAMIEAAGLTKYYGKYMSIESVGFTVEKGEIFGIVGAEDADRKSTRLNSSHLWLSRMPSSA